MKSCTLSPLQYRIYTYFTLQLFKKYLSAICSKKSPDLFQNLFFKFLFHVFLIGLSWKKRQDFENKF